MIVPPLDFDKSTLTTAKIDVGEQFGRILHARYLDALGFGKTLSRFSDPRAVKPHERFGVLYLGSTYTVCFLETIIRDLRDGLAGEVPLL
ncbi:MAG: hypothetical protein AAF220_10215 [Pseudomonadota bacterium]